MNEKEVEEKMDDIKEKKVELEEEKIVKEDLPPSSEIDKESKDADSEEKDASHEEEVEAKPSEEEASKEESERFIRLMADFQNYKNRVEKQKSEIYKQANERIISKLLEILDNFDRALLGETKDEAFKSGMEMILNQFTSLLNDEGLEEIPTENQEFDPNLHNAVMVEEADNIEENKILETFQKGYCLNGKVIRPSMVKVSK